MEITKPVLLIGGGPSLNDVDFSTCPRDKFFIIGTNKAYKLIMPDVLLFMDKKFFKWNFNELMHLSCKKITTAPDIVDGQQHSAKVRQNWAQHGVEYYSKESPKGLNLSPHKLLCGNNSGHQALNLAIKYGARQIYLLGFDMKPSEDGNAQFHNEHKEKTNVLTYAETMIPKFIEIAPIVKNLGVSVYNCNPDSALRCFDFTPVPW